MYKPTLVLLQGYGWAGTTPLYYSLAQAKYCLSPVRKEPHYLCQVFREDLRTRKTSLLRKPNLAQKPPEWKIDIPNLEYYDIDKTLNKYIELMKESYNLIKNTHAAVADFSVSNKALKPYLSQLTPLSEHFNVKVLQITRDPIRRAYSHFTSKKNNNTWEDCIRTSSTYQQDYDAWSSYFPVHSVKMENLWDEDTKNELERLSEFLDYEISALYPNVYSKTNPPTDTTWLMDQVVTDDPPLTNGKYKLMRSKYSFLYDRW